MTTDAIYNKCGSDWSHQVSAVGTTQRLQHDQTLPLSAKGVACKNNKQLHKLCIPLQIFPMYIHCVVSHYKDITICLDVEALCL